MDTFSRNDVQALVGEHSAPCISLLMPTTRAAGQQDKIRWRGLVREASERLQAQGMKPRLAEEALRSARELLDDVPFWLNVSQGLAGFISADSKRIFRLPFPLRERVVVAQHFHVKPMLPLLAGEDKFYVLSLSQKHVRLLRATPYAAEEVPLRGIPGNMEEALHYGGEVKARMQGFHTHPSRGGPAGRQEKITHGQGVGVEDAKEGLLEYFQQVDRGLHRHLNREQAPLVVAAADFLLPIYRRANTYPHLLEEGIEGHPDRLSVQQLQQRAWPVAEPYFRRKLESLSALYRQLAGTGRTANQLPEVLRAAFEGKIQHLFVSLRDDCWGRCATAAENVEVHETPLPGDEDLLNLAAVFTLQHKGAVYALDPERLPDDSPLSAIYWLPAGER